MEGAITILVAMVAFFFLPDTPGAARFLSEEEQTVAVNALHRDLHGATMAKRVEDEHFNWQEVHFIGSDVQAKFKTNDMQVRFALLNVNTIVMSINFFLILVPIYSYSLFLPTIISGLGYERVTAQLFTVPPNFLAFLSVIAFAWTSDKLKMRGPLIVAGLLVATIGYIMQLASDQNAVKYAGTFFISVGAFPCSPLILAWLSNNLSPHTTKATGLGFQVAIGNCGKSNPCDKMLSSIADVEESGAFVATWTYLKQDAPDYVTGHAINLGAIGISLCLTAANMLYIRWENAARHSGKREYRLAGTDGSHLGYRHPEYRYTL